MIGFAIFLLVFISVMQLGNKVFGAKVWGSLFGLLFLAIPLVAIGAVLFCVISTLIIPLVFAIAPVTLFLGAVGFIVTKIAKGGNQTP